MVRRMLAVLKSQDGGALVSILAHIVESTEGRLIFF